MLKHIKILVVAATVLGASTSSVYAATVNVVHGIDGRDLGAAKALPVDIAVNGSCALKGVNFTQSAQVELTPATYVITVHPANGSCTLSPVITQSVTIDENSGRSFSAVASLTQDGKPQLAVFDNSKDLAFTPVVSTRHLAAAGPISVTYNSSELSKPTSARIRNGKFSKLGVLGARLPFTVTVSAGAKGKPIARRTGVARRQYVIFNIVGSRQNGFTVIAERLAP